MSRREEDDIIAEGGCIIVRGSFVESKFLR